MNNRHDPLGFVFRASVVMAMLSSPLIARAADVRQENRVTHEVASGRALSTNEPAVLAQCVETLKRLTNNKTSEQRRIAIAKLSKLRPVAVLPALQAAARDETENC